MTDQTGPEQPPAPGITGYCPACGRGDVAPTAEEYEQQRQRAETAEAERKTLGQTALGYQQRAWDAEAAITRVRAVVSQLHADAAAARADGYETSAFAIDGSARRITYALESAEQLTPAATQATDGHS
ncbi:hypothetical protein ACFUN7_24370 [Streptomyces sp. NPDC057236]|uniref:hypothetical protein n=1 Tax=Streptomyces sp. NPDC057236 TaxID=3346059 RepID=UPI003644D7AA